MSKKIKTTSPRQVGDIIWSDKKPYRVVREVLFIAGETTSDLAQDMGHYSCGTTFGYECASLKKEEAQALKQQRIEEASAALAAEKLAAMENAAKRDAERYASLSPFQKEAHDKHIAKMAKYLEQGYK